MKLSSVICLFATSITGVICSGEDLVKQYVEQVWNAHNPSALKKFIQPDYVRRAAVFPRLPRAQEERHVGIEHFSNYLTRVFKSMPDLTVELEDVIGEGNQVYYTFISKGTQYSTSWGQASGKYMEAKCAAHHRLDEVSGKIAFSEIFCDFAGIIQHFAPSPITIRDTINMDNTYSGIEAIMSGKILRLNEALNDKNVNREKLLAFYDVENYKAISPAYPQGLDANQKIDFILAMRQCITPLNENKPIMRLLNFYYDQESGPCGGLSISWRLEGVHSNKCPAPYDKYTPTKKQILLDGVSYHRLNCSLKLVESSTIYDNNYLKALLQGGIQVE